jgi:hypothetical protein
MMNIPKMVVMILGIAAISLGGSLVFNHFILSCILSFSGGFVIGMITDLKKMEGK